MSNITVLLPEEDLAFLRAYSKTQGISAEAFLAQQAHNLRMNLQKPLSPEVIEASGIISPDVASVRSFFGTARSGRKDGADNTAIERDLADEAARGQS